MIVENVRNFPYGANMAAKAGGPMANAPMAGADDGGKAPTADFNMFLKLLIAQMKNQDPTNPGDPTKFVSQLATFSAVEQATQTNKKLDELFAGTLSSQASNYIGKHFEYKGKDGKVLVAGNIKAVKIFSDGLVAVLDNGKEAIIGPGVEISDPVKKNDDKKKAEDILQLSDDMQQAGVIDNSSEAMPADLQDNSIVADRSPLQQLLSNFI